MTSYGPPDPNRPDDSPTRYLPPVEEPVPWYRKPAAYVGFGAGGAVLVALIVYGIARAIMGGDSPSEPTSLTPLSSTSRSAVTTTAPSSEQTVTETVTPTSTEPTTTTTTPTTTESTTTTTTTTTTEPSTSVSTSTSTSTVTETVTVPGG